MKITFLAVCSVLLISGCSITPTVIDQNEQLNNTQTNLNNIWNKQQQIAHDINLPEAIARTLKYNLDNRVNQAQLMLENGNLTMAYLEMLPSLNVSTDYSFRNNEQIQNLVRNGQLVDGEQSFTPREVLNVSTGLQWNILDLGLSYTRAQQQANRIMIMQEQIRKTTQNLIQECISVYLKAWTAQQIYPKVKEFQEKATLALEKSKEVLKQKVNTNDTELDYQNVLIKSIRKANKLLIEIADAKSSLSRLMNVKPGSNYMLLSPKKDISSLPDIQPQFEKMDVLAFLNRPELLEGSYQVKIAEKGIQAAILEMLPGISFNYGYNYTSNKFMLNQEWLGGNINLAVDLINSLISGPFNIKRANTAVDFEKMKQAAATITVLTQIRIAYNNYMLWKNDLAYSKQEAKTTDLLHQSALDKEAANHGNAQITIRRALDSLNSEFDHQVTFANAYEALAKLYQSIGLDFLSDSDRYLPLNTLTKKIERMLQAQSKGSFNQLIDEKYKTFIDSQQPVKDVKQTTLLKNTPDKTDKLEKNDAKMNKK